MNRPKKYISGKKEHCFRRPRTIREIMEDNQQTAGGKAPGTQNSSWKSVLLHLVLVLAATALVIIGALALLKVYTRWGEAIQVPPITGMSRADAEKELRKLDLEMKIIDSVYVEAAPRGIVMDSNPAPGSKVKSRRTIFVTVNANSARRIVLPQVVQLSRRQAIAALRGSGFVQIEERFVPGEFNDLVLSVTDGETGLALTSGSRLAYNAPIMLEISSVTLMDSLRIVNQALSYDTPAAGVGSAAGAWAQEAPAGSRPAQPATPDEDDPDDWF